MRNRITSIMGKRLIVFSLALYAAGIILPVTANAVPGEVSDPVEEVVTTTTTTVDPVTDTVDPAGETLAGDTVGEVVEGTVVEAVDETADVAEDTTGSVDDAADVAVEETTAVVDDAVATVVDTAVGALGDDPVKKVVDTVKKTVGDLEVVDDLSKTINDLTTVGGAGDDRADRGRRSLTGPDVHSVLGRRGSQGSDTSSRSFGIGTLTGLHPALSTGTNVTPSAPAPSSLPGPGAFSDLGRVAIEATKKLAFPLALSLMVIAFLVFQSRVDRTDPKMALAPVDSDQDLLSFS